MPSELKSFKRNCYTVAHTPWDRRNFLNNSGRSEFIKNQSALKCLKCTNLHFSANRFFIYVVVGKLFKKFPFVTLFAHFITWRWMKPCEPYLMLPLAPCHPKWKTNCSILSSRQQGHGGLWCCRNNWLGKVSEATIITHGPWRCGAVLYTTQIKTDILGVVISYDLEFKLQILIDLILSPCIRSCPSTPLLANPASWYHVV